MGDLAGGSPEKFFLKVPKGYYSMTHEQKKAWATAASQALVQNLERKSDDENEKQTGKGNPYPAS